MGKFWKIRFCMYPNDILDISLTSIYLIPQADRFRVNQCSTFSALKKIYCITKIRSEWNESQYVGAKIWGFSILHLVSGSSLLAEIQWCFFGLPWSVSHPSTCRHFWACPCQGPSISEARPHLKGKANGPGQCGWGNIMKYPTKSGKRTQSTQSGKITKIPKPP